MIIDPPPSSSSASDRVAALADEFVARFRKGERPALTEYTARYPELAEEILAIFPALVEMEQLGPIRNTGARAGDATDSPRRSWTVGFAGPRRRESRSSSRWPRRWRRIGAGCWPTTM